ncbi:MAG: 3-dehydroquinate synthase [Bacteroidota bacterium]
MSKIQIIRMHTFNSEAYTIEVGPIEESSFNSVLLNNYANSKIVIIVDENTHDACLEYLLTTFDALKEAEVMLLPAGEENKVMEVCFQVWEALSEYQIGRKDLIINLGGGVVTDMGGFIASIFKRGIDFIHLPTSLLAMVDAAIGGKTGIDLGPLKNQLGVFAHPKHIYVDPIFLGSLPPEEFLNGYAEMLKHGLIYDKALWDKLKVMNDLAQLADIEVLMQCIAVKQTIVEQDPTEKGIRKVLNYGHTVGHAIEGFFMDKDPIAHGHAVAIGMLAEAHISMKRTVLAKEAFHEIETIILQHFPMIHLEEEDIKEIIRLTLHDKKNEQNKINCTLLSAIGDSLIDCFVSEEELNEALNYLTIYKINLN